MLLELIRKAFGGWTRFLGRPPKTVVLIPDDYHIEHVGHTVDGRQFFLTYPFVPVFNGEPGREFVALYLFDRKGVLVDDWIEDLGSREEVDSEVACALGAALLDWLGPVERRRIKISPFRLERFGVEFGLVQQPPDELNETWTVIVEPGDYLCFWPPWSGGGYDT
jgi:hypothetical protein